MSARMLLAAAITALGALITIVSVRDGIGLSFPLALGVLLLVDGALRFAMLGRDDEPEERPAHTGQLLAAGQGRIGAAPANDGAAPPPRTIAAAGRDGPVERDWEERGPSAVAPPASTLPPAAPRVLDHGEDGDRTPPDTGGERDDEDDPSRTERLPPPTH